MTMTTTTAELTHILQTCRTIAVVGLSPKPDRASFGVAQYMQVHGYCIVPVNPVAAAAGQVILGEKVYASLLDAAKVEKIDMVDCFRNSEDIPPLVTEAIQIGAKVLWMQLGIVNEAAKTEAEAAGLQVVQDRCLKIDHRQLAHLL
jgi:uncharacterized protein